MTPAPTTAASQGPEESVCAVPGTSSVDKLLLDVPSLTVAPPLESESPSNHTGLSNR